MINNEEHQRRVDQARSARDAAPTQAEYNRLDAEYNKVLNWHAEPVAATKTVVKTLVIQYRPKGLEVAQWVDSIFGTLDSAEYGLTLVKRWSDGHTYEFRLIERTLTEEVIT